MSKVKALTLKSFHSSFTAINNRQMFKVETLWIKFNFALQIVLKLLDIKYEFKRDIISITIKNYRELKWVLSM